LLSGFCTDLGELEQHARSSRRSLLLKMPFPLPSLILRSGRARSRKSFSHDSAQPFFVCGVIVNKRLQGFLNVDRGDDPHRPRSFSHDPPSKSEPRSAVRLSSFRIAFAPAREVKRSEIRKGCDWKNGLFPSRNSIAAAAQSAGGHHARRSLLPAPLHLRSYNGAAASLRRRPDSSQQQMRDRCRRCAAALCIIV
jgi:hypothetical protein